MSANVDSLANELARLETLDRAGLVVEWHKLYKAPPPYRMSPELMLRALTYKVQEVAYGGLSRSVRERLIRLATTGQVAAPALKSGTRLLREWHGVTHEVRIGEDGVHYRGQCYRSLSEVAFVITGTKWSGPVFFGLKKRKA